MSRRPRESSPLNLYHICDRGVERRVIFDDDEDRRQFVFFLKRVFERAEGELLAWCLMSNHVHLVVKMELLELSKTMRDLMRNYAIFYNERHGRTGYLFEGRFRSQAIDTEDYLLAAIRYVHQNPLKAGMTRTCLYPWSSYLEYLGEPKFTSTDLVLGILGGKEGFLSLHDETAEDPQFLDFDNGWPMSEDEAWEVACRVIGSERAKSLDALELKDRDECIRLLLKARIPGTYVAKFAKTSKSNISKIKNKPAQQ